MSREEENLMLNVLDRLNKRPYKKFHYDDSISVDIETKRSNNQKSEWVHSAVIDNNKD
jgi:hypothetical protein